MSTASPAIRDLARRLVAFEAARAKAPDARLDDAVLACQKLRLPLEKFAGTAGFRSLLSRALALTKAQIPLLEPVRVGPDALLQGFEELGKNQRREEAATGGIVLVAELLGLLVTFIGGPLTLRLVREAWPDASINTLDLGKQP